LQLLARSARARHVQQRARTGGEISRAAIFLNQKSIGEQPHAAA